MALALTNESCWCSLSTAQEAQSEYNRGGGGARGGGGGDQRTVGRGTAKEVQDPTERFGARRDNARRGNAGPRTPAADQQHTSNGKKLPPGQNNSGLVRNQEQNRQAQRRRERGDGGGRASGGGVSRLEAPAASRTSRSPRSPQSRSPANKPINLEKMSGFGPGDRGWSERVENRRQQQLAQRNRGSASVVAEINHDSGKIEPLTPTAPAASFDGHHQAVSPPRLRRLLHSEV